MKQKEDINFDTEENKNNSTNDENQSPVSENADEKSATEAPASSLELELKEANDKYLRLYSDFENYKKRMSRERIEQSKMAGSDILISFLPVIDDIERAVKSAEETSDPESVLAGVKLISAKLKNIAESKGIKAMDAKGKPFDPELHDAIANVPTPEGMSKGNVIEEIEKGYFLNDKVIRHAKVIVGN